MTEVKTAGAAPAPGNAWNATDWRKVKAQVRRLQMRIAKAVREGRRNKARALQWLLTHSLYAKLLATLRVSTGKGAKTPGTDGVIWNTPARKMNGALSLRRRGCKASPLRRIEIPKKNGRKRPLGIPTMRDRAMQALYLPAPEPAAETTADGNSHGFRPYRACRDAVGQCFCALGKSYSPKWILEADIKACFDGISHDWLMKNIPVDKRMLRQWPECGFVQKGKLFRTRAGTPQGGVISPVLANMTLDGLEQAVRKSCPCRRKVNFVRYADDFIVTADCEELPEKNVMSAINEFPEPRGLLLSAEKTKIVRIEQGFDFLGQNLRKYRNKLIIKPPKDNAKSFLGKVRKQIRSCHGRKCEDMIRKLNPVIRGWSNYHKNIQAAEAFSRADTVIFQSLWRWCKRRHPNKNAGWIKNRYFNHPKGLFSCKVGKGRRKGKIITLIRASQTKLVRYIKIRGKSNPYDKTQEDCLKMRRRLNNATPIRGVKTI